VDNPFQSPAILSVCPGFLGLERGLTRAIGEINIVAYVEIEAFIVENIICGMEAGILDPAPVWTDVKTFNAKPFYKKIHGIIGGYPCQPFSTAGRRKGQDDPRHLWPYLHRIIQAARPVWCFFENVGGHLSMGYDQVYKDLRDIGYTVEAGLFTAEEMGAPHERERLFILAIDQQFLAHSNQQYDDWIGECRQRRRFEDSNRREGRKQLADYAGGQPGLQPPGYWWQDIGGGSKEMEYTDSNVHPGRMGNGGNNESSGQNKGEENKRERIWDEPGTAGSQLAHTNSAGQPQQRYDAEPGCQDDNRAGHTGAEISDTYGTNVQRPVGLQTSGGQQQSADSSDEGDRWPAGPGQPQHHWEEKRTIEPGMGCTINGYNFKEDLLRALGNSVVEQTAEFAFISLLKKHARNIEMADKK